MELNGILLGFTIGNIFFIKEYFQTLKNENFCIGLLRPKIKFLLNEYLSNFSSQCYLYIDKIMIAIIFSYETLAHYQFAMQYLLLANFLPPLMFNLLLPSESATKPNKKLKSYFVIFAISFAVIAAILAPIIIENLFPQYLRSVFAIQILNISIIPIVFSTLLEISFLVKENSRIVLFVNIVQTGLYFPLLFVLGDTLNITGFALAFLISCCGRLLFGLLIRRIYDI